MEQLGRVADLIVHELRVWDGKKHLLIINAMEEIDLNGAESPQNVFDKGFVYVVVVEAFYALSFLLNLISNGNDYKQYLGSTC